jgi:DNA-binding NtrC family response regulator
VPTRVLREKSILVVDDDAAMLRALEKVLRQAGCLVTRAQSGDEALEQLGGRAKRFDLVITDLCMPLVNGGTILHAVKTVFPELPIMIITAYAGPNTKVEFLQQGAAAFLEKPVDSPRLLAEVSRILTSADKKGTNPDPNH